MSQITKYPHNVIPPVDCQPPPYPSSKTFGGEWRCGQNTDVSLGNQCLHALSVHQPCLRAATFKKDHIYAPETRIMLCVSYIWTETSPRCRIWPFRFFYSVAILKSIWVFRTSTNIYCTRWKNPRELTTPSGGQLISSLEEVDSLSAGSQVFRGVFRPEALCDIPTVSFVRKMNPGW